MAIFTDILSFLVPAYTSLSPFSMRGRIKKEEERYKGEPLQKLARFWREFDHFHGNFTMNLAFSKFPKFQVFFENSTKNPESFGVVEVIDDDTMTIERKLFCILIKGIQTSQRNCGISQKLREFR